MDPRLDKQREAGDNSMKSFAFHTLQHICIIKITKSRHSVVLTRSTKGRREVHR